MAFIHPYIFVHILYIYISYLVAASLNVSLRLKRKQTCYIQLNIYIILITTTQQRIQSYVYVTDYHQEILKQKILDK